MANVSKMLELTKRSVNTLNDDILKDHIERIIDKAIGKTYRNNGWRGKYDGIADMPSPDGGHKYNVCIHFIKVQKRVRENADEVSAKQFADIVQRAIDIARQHNWVVDNQIQNQDNQLTEIIKTYAQNFQAINLPSDIVPYFKHIYNRDAQIRIIYSAICAAKSDNFNTRNHCLLWGRPSCGKTDTLLAFEQMLGTDNVVKLDATSTTKAGAENLLLDLNPIPPVIIIEELEKCNPINLPWLLGVMDHRGEIRKTNARTGDIRKDAKCLILATVNNLAEFKTVMSGALASRFQHKIYFPRPNRDILEKILQREIERIGGNPAWIQPALDYCLTIEKTDDPRRCISVLDGGSRLMDHSYQLDLIEIREQMLKDNINEG